MSVTLLKQNTAVDLPIGPFLDDTDGKTPKTALSLVQADFRLKKNGANWAQKNQASSATHEENGNYEYSMDGTDTNTLGLLRVHVAKATALPVWESYLIVAANIYDSWVLGTDQLQVDAVQLNGQTTSLNNLERAASSILVGTVAAGSSASSINTSGVTESQTDHFKDRQMIFLTGALARQAKQILAYNGSTKAFTTAPFTGAPANGDTFVVV